MSQPERRNPLQAVLDRQLPREPEPPPPAPPRITPPKFHRPVRDGRRFMGGHFDPKVVRAVKQLALDEDTTQQALWEEALNLLFIKKGRGKIIE